MTTESTFIEEKVAAEGKWGPYYDPVAEASPEMRKIVGESCSTLGGTAAVLLQIAYKSVGLGVAAHSSFTLRPIQRGRRSVVYIYAQVFGSLAERRYVTDQTHRAHAHVKGAGYDADDVDAQLWVAATTYWSLIASYELVLGKLDDRTADQVYREFSVMATGLRVPPERWPEDRRAFQEYWDAQVAALEITPEARQVAQDVLYPAKHLSFPLSLLLRLMGPFFRTVNIELLPERVRNELGIPSTDYTKKAYKRMMKIHNAIYRATPKFVRHLPKNIYMWDFRRRMAKGAAL
ncbi:hypothetical protein BX600DRAFT_510928 [Xylariales sp. PMI_506]|nr:hypothetical protein BX600DRAFT_510928 [Xylariales sp. PMI_506]